VIPITKTIIGLFFVIFIDYDVGRYNILVSSCPEIGKPCNKTVVYVVDNFDIKPQFKPKDLVRIKGKVECFRSFDQEDDKIARKAWFCNSKGLIYKKVGN